MATLCIDTTLLEGIIGGTRAGLQMAGIDPPPVGTSRFFTTPRKYSVMVGLLGLNNGSMAINISERGMLHVASKLLCEEQTEVNESNLDAICEVGNMIAGCTKEQLANTEFEVANISVPSLIVGAQYNVYCTRGITTVSVEFELEDIPISYQQDRFFSSTISLMRRVA